jgi:hypothetical protein
MRQRTYTVANSGIQNLGGGFVVSFDICCDEAGLSQAKSGAFSIE